MTLSAGYSRKGTLLGGMLGADKLTRYSVGIDIDETKKIYERGIILWVQKN